MVVTLGYKTIFFGLSQGTVTCMSAELSCGDKSAMESGLVTCDSLLR